MVDFAKLLREKHEHATPAKRARIDAFHAEEAARMARSRPIEATFVRSSYNGRRRNGEVVETGRETKAIRIRIDERPSEYADDPRVLVFDGGPTGHESYRLGADLVSEVCRDDRGDAWCICAGTPGSWPACFVSRKAILAFLAEMAPDLVAA